MTPKRLDSHTLVLRARMGAMLEDFGRSAFRRRLDSLLDEINEQSGPEPRTEAAEWFVSLLVRRAQLVDLVKKNPDLATLLAAPTIVVGLPGAQYKGQVLGAPAGFEVSFVGSELRLRLGSQPNPVPTAEEWSEVFWFQRVAWLAEPAEQRRALVGADMLKAPAELLSAYPEARLVLVEADPADCLATALATEASAAHQHRREFDRTEATLYWRAEIDQALAGIDLLIDRVDVEQVN